MFSVSAFFIYVLYALYHCKSVSKKHSSVFKEMSYIKKRTVR